MGVITRDPAGAAGDNYDLIVIGGGVYGAMLLLEAVRRNLRALLVERDDFGGQTSFNSLRIIHGGLRYLQKLDLKRFRESVAERQWFLRTFPDLIRPLPCLMPIYGEGLRRRSILRAALAINDLLSANSRRQGPASANLPVGRIIGAGETRRLFPGVEQAGLQGGAVWYDACMPDSQRVLMEILRWACGFGARALNYVEATELRTMKGRVCGIQARDRETGAVHKYRAGLIINAAGPWCQELASRFTRGQPGLFHPSLAWNVLLARRPPAECALAIAPRNQKGQTYFLVPWKGKLLAGTGHVPWKEKMEAPRPSAGQMAQFLAGLNAAAPGLAATSEEVIHVFAGFLPAARPGTALLATREKIIDHGRAGGAKNLFTVSGVKFTTARLVAQKTLSQAFPGFHPSAWEEKIGGDAPGRGIFCNGAPPQDPGEDEPLLRALITEESVRRFDDLFFRRTDLWLDQANREKLLQAPLAFCQEGSV